MAHPPAQSVIGFSQKEAAIAARDAAIKLQQMKERAAVAEKIARQRALRLSGQR
jgi:hypothetical protein